MHSRSDLLVVQACEIFGLTREDLVSQRRGVVALARWALCYIHRQHMGWTYERIGALFGKDHTVAIYGYTQACVLLHEQVQPFTEAIELMERLHGYA